MVGLSSETVVSTTSLNRCEVGVEATTVSCELWTGVRIVSNPFFNRTLFVVVDITILLLLSSLSSLFLAVFILLLVPDFLACCSEFCSFLGEHF